jgi:hypothetical protein
MSRLSVTCSENGIGTRRAAKVSAKAESCEQRGPIVAGDQGSCCDQGSCWGHHCSKTSLTVDPSSRSVGALPGANRCPPRQDANGCLTRPVRLCSDVSNAGAPHLFLYLSALFTPPFPTASSSSSLYLSSPFSCAAFFFSRPFNPPPPLLCKVPLLFRTWAALGGVLGIQG